jgi:hypothetical protein
MPQPRPPTAEGGNGLQRLHSHGHDSVESGAILSFTEQMSTPYL